MEILNHRGGLVRFRDAVNNKDCVRVGLIGRLNYTGKRENQLA